MGGSFAEVGRWSGQPRGARGQRAGGGRLRRDHISIKGESELTHGWMRGTRRRRLESMVVVGVLAWLAGWWSAWSYIMVGSESNDLITNPPPSDLSFLLSPHFIITTSQTEYTPTRITTTSSKIHHG